MIVERRGQVIRRCSIGWVRQTSLQVFHMDHIHWQPDWVPRPRALRREMAQVIEAQGALISEGGFLTIEPACIARPNRLIWLDLSMRLRLRRVTPGRLLRSWGQAEPGYGAGMPPKRSTWIPPRFTFGYDKPTKSAGTRSNSF